MSKHGLSVITYSERIADPIVALQIAAPDSLPMLPLVQFIFILPLKYFISSSVLFPLPKSLSASPHLSYTVNFSVSNLNKMNPTSPFGIPFLLAITNTQHPQFKGEETYIGSQ